MREVVGDGLRVVQLSFQRENLMLHLADQGSLIVHFVTPAFEAAVRKLPLLLESLSNVAELQEVGEEYAKLY